MTVAHNFVRVLCVFEDRAFEDVVVPVVDRVFADAGFEDWTMLDPLKTRGCRWGALESILGDWRDGADLIVIGADAKEGSVARKRAAMAEHVEAFVHADRVVYALPKPCAEGWLQADLRALKTGVQDALEMNVSLPGDAGPYPEHERAAKDRLGALLSRSGVPTLRGGLELGPAVMAHVDLLGCHSSLSDFVHELQRWLRDRAPRAGLF